MVDLLDGLRLVPMAVGAHASTVPRPSMGARLRGGLNAHRSALVDGLEVEEGLLAGEPRPCHCLPEAGEEGHFPRFLGLFPQLTHH